MKKKLSPLPPRALSTLDNKLEGKEMRYLIQPRGPGKSWVFRMKTPPELIGKTNPITGKPFVNEIRIGLGTRRLSEARAGRDIMLGKIREAQAALTDDSRFSIDMATVWADEIRKEEANGSEPDEVTVDVRSILYDQIEAAQRERKVPAQKLAQFARVATGTGYPLSEAAPRYIKYRAKDNRLGIKPLAQKTVLDLNTALRDLWAFMGEGVCLQDIDRATVQKFRDEFLPERRSPRAPDGPSPQTIQRKVSLLAGIWEWAVDATILSGDIPNPWKGRRGIPRQKRSREVSGTFSAEQAQTFYNKLPRGHRLGDLLRLSIVTGMRMNEIAALNLTDVREDGSAFDIPVGKTDNAARFIPLIAPAQEIVRARLLAVGEGGQLLFPEWPVRPSTGKRSAASSSFTYYRRKFLGRETDGKLKFHSARHTWRTAARRARVREADILDLGGWAGAKTTDQEYDHGLVEQQLRETQELIGGRLEEEGYLTAF